MKTKEEIETLNSLIAVFDGLEKIAYIGNIQYFRVPNLYPFHQMNDEENTGYIDILALELDYHTRFDWLMPVVKKIKAIDMVSRVPERLTYSYSILIEMLDKALLNVLFDVIYDLVVRIITLFNHIKNTKTVS